METKNILLILTIIILICVVIGLAIQLQKNILLILTIIILICVVIGLAIQLQSAKNVTPAVVNNTTNNTTVNTTVEHINNDTALQSNSNNQASHSDSQASQSGMPEDRQKIYAARQKAADDGIPMYEYIHSPELVEKYQNMV